MSALGDLRKSYEKLNKVQSDIRYFLEKEDSRLRALGYEADAHIDTPIVELEDDPEKYATWLLGQLLAVHRDNPKGQIMIASMTTWMVYTIKVLNPTTEDISTGETE